MGENNHWQFSSFSSNFCIPYYRNMDIPYSEIFENESINLFFDTPNSGNHHEQNM